MKENQPPFQNPIELLRKKAQFYELEKFIWGLGTMIRKSAPEDKKEEANAKADEWRDSSVMTVNSVISDKITIDQALPILTKIYAEMKHYAENVADISDEEITEANLLAHYKDQGTEKLLRAVLDFEELPEDDEDEENEE